MEAIAIRLEYVNVGVILLDALSGAALEDFLQRGVLSMKEAGGWAGIKNPQLG